MNRRQFLRSGAAAGAAAGLPTIIPSTALGKEGAVPPSERVAVGLIACGRRAGYAGMYQRYGKSEVVAVCDPIRSRRLDFKRRFNNCDDYNDFRDLLAREDVDAVHISTADHRHVPIAIMAAKAGMKGIPVKYEGTGTIPAEGLFNTITHWDVNCTYANGLRMRLMDNVTANRQKPHPGVEGSHGTLFVGSDGWVRVSREGWKTSSEELRRKAKDPGENRLKVSRDQIQNFVDCVLFRETPVDDLHSAVRSDAATHPAEISVRTGRPITRDPKRERIKGDKEAAKLMKREMRKPWTL